MLAANKSDTKPELKATVMKKDKVGRCGVCLYTDEDGSGRGFLLVGETDATEPFAIPLTASSRRHAV